MANRSSGGSRRFMEKPEARKATDSASDDILPNPVKMPTSNAIGMVKVKTLGTMATDTAQISETVADWRTMTSSSDPISRVNASKATKVSAAKAMREGNRISFKM